MILICVVQISMFLNLENDLDAYTCTALKVLICTFNSDLKTLILNKNHQITTLSKDEHTQIVLQE